MPKKIKTLSIPVKTHEDAVVDSLLKLQFNFDGYSKWTCELSPETMSDMVDMINNRNFPTNKDSIISIADDEKDDYLFPVPLETVEKLLKHLKKLEKHIDSIGHTPTRLAFSEKIVDVYRLLQNADKY